MRNRLRDLRLDRGLTQEELAEKLGTTKQHLGRLENSKSRLSTEWIERLAEALQCHPLELLEDTVPAVTPDEKAVLELYRGLAEADRRAFLQIASSLPKSAGSNADDEGDPASRPKPAAA
ncbi:helix-turn-helix domain-containing protein [Ferrovibrio sp.]|uniref:helix-turn-helix domain-containing protein n=1 Tax=Ferrovibrio sp. TaxID=1917215 RepID=UPI003D0CE97F